MKQRIKQRRMRGREERGGGREEGEEREGKLPWSSDLK